MPRLPAALAAGYGGQATLPKIEQIMIIFLYGKDSYRRQKRANFFIEEYRKKYSNLSLDYFDLDPSTSSRLSEGFGGQAGQDEFSRLKEFASQMLIFDNKKMAVLKNTFVFDLKELKEFLKANLSAEDLTILLSEEDVSPEELKTLLKKAFLVEKFDYLDGDEWLSFIQKEANRRKISFTSQAVYFLARIFNGDSWGMINELDKAVLLNKKSAIEPEDLIKIGNYNQESPDIFDFINRVLRNWPLPERIVALERLFISQEEPVKIFNIMASLKRLPKDLIKKLADYDVVVKSGKIDYEEILLSLALSG